MTPTCEDQRAENSLAKRLLNHKRSIPEDVMQELQAIGSASQPPSAKMEELMDQISQLGHVPTQAKTASAEEKSLAVRLRRARKAGSLTREQEAAFDNLA